MEPSAAGGWQEASVRRELIFPQPGSKAISSVRLNHLIFPVSSKHSLIINLDFLMRSNHSCLTICFGITCANKTLDRSEQMGRGDRERGSCVPWRLFQLGVSDWYLLSGPCHALSQGRSITDARIEVMVSIEFEGVKWELTAYNN